MRTDIKVLEENMGVTQKQINKLYIARQNISALTEKMEQLQKRKGDLLKSMEKITQKNNLLSKENQRLKSKGVFVSYTLLSLHNDKTWSIAK